MDLFVSTVIIADNDKTENFGLRFKSAVETSGGVQAMQAFMSGLNGSGLLFKEIMAMVDEKLMNEAAGMGEWNYASALDTSLGAKIDESVEIKNGSTIIMDATANNRRLEDETSGIFDKSAISRISPRISKLTIRD